MSIVNCAKFGGYMNLYENVKAIAKEKGYSINRLEKELGFARSYISKFKNITPSMDKVQKIADFLGVSVDYLLIGKEKEIGGQTLTSKDERDIAKDLDDIMKKIESGEDGPLRYNGDEIDAESLALLKDAIGMSLRHLKIINKEKYNPNKNKK